MQNGYEMRYCTLSYIGMIEKIGEAGYHYGQDKEKQ